MVSSLESFQIGAGTTAVRLSRDGPPSIDRADWMLLSFHQELHLHDVIKRVKHPVLQFCIFLSITMAAAYSAFGLRQNYFVHESGV